MTSEFPIDYGSILSGCAVNTKEARIAHLSEELPYKWLDQYLRMANHKVNALRIQESGFLYIYDFYSEFVLKNQVPENPKIEDRLIGVLGLSKPCKEERDASRQRGWAGKSGKLLGKANDKGHFVAHTIGGGFEINVFIQLRKVNRGWSARGKIYRAMETYCRDNPETFVFSRPFYNDESARPSRFEFGLLKADGEIWLESFEN